MALGFQFFRKISRNKKKNLYLNVKKFIKNSYNIYSMIIFTRTKNRFKIKNNGSKISIFSKNIIEIKKKIFI